MKDPDHTHRSRIPDATGDRAGPASQTAAKALAAQA